MKRLLVLIPSVLFVILNACSDPNSLPAQISNPQWTEIAFRQTALSWTPTISPTPMYVTEEARIFSDLNNGIEALEASTKFDQLEHTIGATYQLIHIKFLPENNTATELQLDINCECMTPNSKCCTPQRTLVATIMAMNSYPYNITADVPPSIDTLDIRCIQNNKVIGEMFAPWQDVKNFLNGTISGYQFGIKVTEIP
jgi:hypothetical protein